MIHVGRRLEGSALTWLVAHELAELALRVTDYRGEDIERLADSGAAAIIMPREAFLKHARHLSIADMARLYNVSCTAASLRYGEVTGRPTAVIVPTHIHIRGEDWEWGDLPGLAKAKAPPEGVDRARLFDATKRVRLIVRKLPRRSCDVVGALAGVRSGDRGFVGARKGPALWVGRQDRDLAKRANHGSITRARLGLGLGLGFSLLAASSAGRARLVAEDVALAREGLAAAIIRDARLRRKAFEVRVWRGRLAVVCIDHRLACDLPAGAAFPLHVGDQVRPLRRRALRRAAAPSAGGFRATKKSDGKGDGASTHRPKLWPRDFARQAEFR